MSTLAGEHIIARSIAASRIKDSYGNYWQYNSRSDRHSKIACWAIMFDVLHTCSLLREHVLEGKVAFGINHELRDFKQDRKKNLDLVLCTGRENVVTTFNEYGTKNGVELSSEEKRVLGELPVMQRASVANVLVALEAKACMTEHVKALPRLHDELSSSHQTIHGDTEGAIAAGYVMINCSERFVSSDKNKKKIRSGKAIYNEHSQPQAAIRTLEAIQKLPRRSGEHDRGFDALGVSMIDCKNDGSNIVMDDAYSSHIPSILSYGSLIQRLGHLYSTKYIGI